MSKPKVRKMWTPSNWASYAPFGIGHQRPNNYWELIRAGIENRDEMAFAWRILNNGVCDGCALGTSGMTDWTLDGTHLCNIRLRLLRLNTMPAIDDALLSDVAPLKRMSSTTLREKGRLAYPMLRRAGEKGFTRLSWDAALDLIAERVRASDPDRFCFYVTSRGMTNESYYVAQKAARAMGTNNIDNAARICHSPSTNALKESVGVAATTCSYSDWLSADLILFIGSNMANNQPVATKYIHYARKNGARVATINPYQEPGMDNYWIPSIPESSLFGTKITDYFYPVNIGGDVAFLSGVLKHLMEQGHVHREFIDNHTVGYDALKASLEAMEWEPLEQQAGISRDEMKSLAGHIAKAKRAIFVWSMGITQHENGVENVRAIVNLALSGGFVGREGCGLMPIRGHSGVQGGAEMGCYATALPGGKPINTETAREFSDLWGFPVPGKPGRSAVEWLDSAERGEMDMLFSVGGNFLEVLPEPDHVRAAMEKIPLRVHMDIVVSSQMLIEGGDVLLLPAATRYETPGGVTETSTERRVIYSPEIPGRRIGEARPEWEVMRDLARRIVPQHAAAFELPDTAAVREDISRAVPPYARIRELSKKGDQFQYGGAHLCADWKFETADGKAHFAPVPLPRREIPEGWFLAATRRGKQFNSMVHEKKDMLNGAVREAVLMSIVDAENLGVTDGDPVVLRNEKGEYHGRVCIAPLKPGNLQIHWPEGNHLLDRHRRSPDTHVPDYNALVSMEKAKDPPKAPE
ncbi:MAG: FdhF/YdeP family oxidoreductase [Candidatus Sumerlaeia bacterium]|nr:FdhF/YdeP family oxidoreductase [Candidatus Sumerlaeia bacterium]